MDIWNTFFFFKKRGQKGRQLLNHYSNCLRDKKIKVASYALQKEQLILGSGRAGLRNIGNTVSMSQWTLILRLKKWTCFILFFASHSVFPECNSAMFVSHMWPAGLLPPEAIQTGEVCQRGCQADRRCSHSSCSSPASSSSSSLSSLFISFASLFFSSSSFASSFLLISQLSLRCWQVFGRKMRKYPPSIRVSFTVFSKKRCHTSAVTGENIFELATQYCSSILCKYIFLNIPSYVFYMI